MTGVQTCALPIYAGKVADHAKGAGLGLTLVKAFAELHGGRLEIESVVDQGTTVRVTLPRHR